jgi:peptidoglycan/LPS O-acetylase OafA/YrhL
MPDDDLAVPLGYRHEDQTASWLWIVRLLAVMLLIGAAGCLRRVDNWRRLTVLSCWIKVALTLLGTAMAFAYVMTRYGRASGTSTL